MKWDQSDLSSVQCHQERHKGANGEIIWPSSQQLYPPPRTMKGWISKPRIIGSFYVHFFTTLFFWLLPFGSSIQNLSQRGEKVGQSNSRKRTKVMKNCVNFADLLHKNHENFNGLLHKILFLTDLLFTFILFTNLKHNCHNFATLD